MPPITRSDFPYPLRTVDGEVDAVVDSMIATTLDVTGQTNLKDLYVSGVTTVVGGIVDLVNITCNTLDCNNDADFNSTVNVDGLATMNAGIQTTAVNCSSLTSTGNVDGTNVIATADLSGATATITNRTTTGQLTVGTNVRFSGLNANSTLGTDASRNVIAVSTTGTGQNVLQTGATLISPNIGNATGASLTLSTPLGVASGGTGSSSLSSVTVGLASNLAGGSAGRIPYQTASGSTSFITTGTSGAVLTSNGTGAPVWNQSLNVSGNVSGVFVSASDGSNPTSAGTGSVAAPNGGISCSRDIWGGARVIANSTTQATSTTDGAIQSLGGISAAGNMYAGGQIRSLSSQNSTSTTTGGITTAGGIAASQDIWAGARVLVQSTTDTTVSTGGAVNVLGGVGIRKNCVVAGDLRGTTKIIAHSTYELQRGGTDRVIIDGDNVGGNRLRINPNNSYNQVVINNLYSFSGLNIFNGVDITPNSFTPTLTDLSGNPLNMNVTENNCSYRDYPGYTIIQFKYTATQNTGGGPVAIKFTGCPDIFQNTALVFGTDLDCNIPGNTKGPFFMVISAASSDWRPSRYQDNASGATEAVDWIAAEAFGAPNSVTFNCTGMAIRY